MHALLISAARGDDPSGLGGIVIIIAVVVAAIVVIGAVWYGLGRTSRREDRRGNVHAPDDPRSRSPRA